MIEPVLGTIDSNDMKMFPLMAISGRNGKVDGFERHIREEEALECPMQRHSDY